MNPLPHTESTAEILRRIRRLEIKTRHLVTNTVAGQYQSVFKGRGMNFEEVREYQPGDEIRSIDWNVTARTGLAHIKKFTEERELGVVLAVDVSASGIFGSRHTSKRELAAEVACALAFSAVRNNDKVGLLLFSDRVEHFLSPRKGRLHTLRLMRDILFHQPAGRGTAPGPALEFLLRGLTRRTVIFLISDFEAELPARTLSLASKRHDLVAVTISDPAEETLPDAGRILLEDAETGEQIEVNTSDPHTRALFAQASLRHSEELNRLLRRNRIDAIPLRTDQDYFPALRAFFRQRERRRARE